ncbi:hypothetical protein IY39_03950 [Flavobacterium psychrophilum]|uniref:hypothetical protein n=1 Tax=Flavobacterium psychrophilum TaxID=96345 RepID=UPI0006187731|nr:hypothetical protein [Flavobacterium psychrophilum]AKC26055.1 hypothetical protein IY39_03950 [Flavobacterium psychrophilum]
MKTKLIVCTKILALKKAEETFRFWYSVLLETAPQEGAYLLKIFKNKELVPTETIDFSNIQGNIFTTSKEVKLNISTGWVAKTDVDTIESLLRSKRAWLNISLLASA